MRNQEACTALTQADVRTRFLAALLFAGITAVCSKVVFHLWFTPVPITLQVFAMVLSGLVLGKRWGAISMVQYLMLGMAGAPVFSSPIAGPAAFAGPTGGYLFGFVAGAYAAGWVFERLDGRTPLAVWLAGISGVIGLYAVGAPWLGLWLGVYAGMPWNEYFTKIWAMGAQPFILVDIAKVMVAAALLAGGRMDRGRLSSYCRLGW